MLQTGNRTVVTVRVSRDDLPMFSLMLARPLGLDISQAVPRHVYLPASIYTFSHAAGGGGRPSGGVFADFAEPDLVPVNTNRDTFWGVELAKLGSYFGWMARGARVEFVAGNGDVYSVTLSYMIAPGEHEDWRLILLDTFLRNGRDSYSSALTARAAAQFGEQITTLELPQGS